MSQKAAIFILVAVRTLNLIYLWKVYKVMRMFDVSRVLYVVPYNISISIVSDYGLDDRAVEVRSPTEVKGFFL
jgi:hypothetical protein